MPQAQNNPVEPILVKAARGLESVVRSTARALYTGTMSVIELFGRKNRGSILTDSTKKIIFGARQAVNYSDDNVALTHQATKMIKMQRDYFLSRETFTIIGGLWLANMVIDQYQDWLKAINAEYDESTHEQFADYFWGMIIYSLQTTPSVLRSLTTLVQLRFLINRAPIEAILVTDFSAAASGLIEKRVAIPNMEFDYTQHLKPMVPEALTYPISLVLINALTKMLSIATGSEALAQYISVLLCSMNEGRALFANMLSNHGVGNPEKIAEICAQNNSTILGIGGAVYAQTILSSKAIERAVGFTIPGLDSILLIVFYNFALLNINKKAEIEVSNDAFTLDIGFVARRVTARIYSDIRPAIREFLEGRQVPDDPKALIRISRKLFFAMRFAKNKAPWLLPAYSTSLSKLIATPAFKQLIADNEETILAIAYYVDKLIDTYHKFQGLVSAGKSVDKTFSLITRMINIVLGLILNLRYTGTSHNFAKRSSSDKGFRPLHSLVRRLAKSYSIPDTLLQFVVFLLKEEYVTKDLTRQLRAAIIHKDAHDKLIETLSTDFNELFKKNEDTVRHPALPTVVSLPVKELTAKQTNKDKEQNEMVSTTSTDKEPFELNIIDGYNPRETTVTKPLETHVIQDEYTPNCEHLATPMFDLKVVEDYIPANSGEINKDSDNIEASSDNGLTHRKPRLNNG